MPSLLIRELSKSFSVRPIIKKFTHNFPKRSITYVVGPNGSGKSTFLNSIINKRFRDSGQLFLDDKDISQWELFKVNQFIRIMPQKPSLFWKLTLGENLALFSKYRFSILFFSRKKKITESINNAYDLLNMFDLINYTHTTVQNLSFGQARILNFICTVYLNSDPSFILLDEPFSGINDSYHGKMIDIIRKMLEYKYSFIIVDHERILIKELKGEIIDFPIISD